MVTGKRKGIWLGLDDLWLEEEAKKAGRSFSSFAKIAMAHYVRDHALPAFDISVDALADAVAERLAARGLIVSTVSGSSLATLDGEAKEILKQSATQLLGG